MANIVVVAAFLVVVGVAIFVVTSVIERRRGLPQLDAPWRIEEHLGHDEIYRVELTRPGESTDIAAIPWMDPCFDDMLAEARIAAVLRIQTLERKDYK